MIFRTIVALLLLLVTVLQSAAQSYVGGAGMVNAGYMYAPAISSSLSSTLGNSFKFQKGFTVIGAEMNYRNHPLVLVASAYVGTSEARSFDGKVIEPFIWKAHGGVGRIIYQGNALSMYPVVGLGTIQSSLTYHSNSNPDINNVMTSPSVDCSLHLDYLLNGHVATNNFFQATMLSARVGYTHGLARNKLQGWNITISFGGIAFLRNKES